MKLKLSKETVDLCIWLLCDEIIDIEKAIKIEEEQHLEIDLVHDRRCLEEVRHALEQMRLIKHDMKLMKEGRVEINGVLFEG